MNQPVQHVERPEAERELFTIKDLCNMTGKCYRTIHRRIQEGKITPVIRLGASVMIPRRVVERIVAKGF
jgi:predicted site-specific integrase-resolvase